MYLPFLKPQWKRHTNPDGSLGGEVATSAKIHPTAIIEPGALVAPRAVVPAHTTVPAGAFFVDSNASLRVDLD